MFSILGEIVFVGVFSSEAIHFSNPFSVQIVEQYRDEPLQRVTIFVGVILLISLLSAGNCWALKETGYDDPPTATYQVCRVRES